MRMQSPSLVVSSSRPLPGNTIKLRNKPMRLFALLALIAVAAMALASTSSSAQVLFGKASLMLGLGSTPASSAMKAAPANPTLTSPNSPLPPSDTMLVERRGHTATRLSNGTVLIAGGENSSGALNECEIYDPSSATFSVIGSMGTARADHSASLLADGRVLIAGGRDATGALNTTEIFDPTTGAFASGPAMGVARAGHSATLFADGRVFVAGGDANGSAEIFDPSTGTFSVTGANMNVARSMHSAALLADGRVLVVGGRNASGDALSSGEIFDTPAASFSTVDSALKVARVGAHLRVLFDGKVQIIGGSNDGSMEIYDPLYGAFGAYAHVIPESDTCAGLPGQVLASQTRAALFHNGQTDPLFDRNGQTITEMSGQALVLGGANSAGSVLSSSSVVASSSAAITTDKMDYAPGETVAVNGRGFQPGETVRVKIHEDPHTPQERGFDAVADADGNFSGEYLVQDYDLKMKFIIGARGITSGATAQTTFTDDKGVTIAFSGTGSGTITSTSSPSQANQLNCNSASGPGPVCSVNFDNTATVTLTASPAVGSTIGTWTVPAGYTINLGCTSGSATCRFTMNNTAQTITVAFNGPANVATTLTLAAPSPASVPFGSSGPVTLSATLTRTTGGAAVVGATVNFTVDASSVGSALTNGSGVASITTYNPSALAVGGHSVQSSFSGATISGTTYTSSTSGTQTLNVTKADQTITFGALANKTYGDADFGVSATASSSLAVSFSSQTLSTCTVSGSTVHIVAAGPCTIRASQAGDGNYNAAPNVDQSFTINKADATFTVTPYNVTYDGLSHTAAVSTITGVNGETGATVGTVNVSNTAHTNAGTYSSDSWSFTGTANYNNQGPTTITDTINKADATFTVTPYNVTYDGLSHTASVSPITGVNGETGATVGTVNVSNTAHTNAGTYSSDSWSFTGTANYNNQGPTTITDTIIKAEATFTVTPYNVTYDGLSHTASVSTITGVNGETGATVGTVDVSNTAHINAGTYSSDSWSFTGTANYNNQGPTTITDTINKADATFTVTPYNVTYDGLSHTASVSTITGVNGETGATVGTVDVSNTAHINAGTYSSDSWSFTGTANYNNQGPTTITDKIDKAEASFTVTPYNVTYDGFAHSTSVSTITGVNGETGATVGTVDVSNTTHTNAGNYASDSWSFTGSANYNNQGPTTITDTINKADATFTVTPYNVTYDGLSHTASVSTITGVNGETGATVGTVDVSNTTHTNAGTYASDYWFFTGTANYNNSANTTITDQIDKANAVVVVTPYSVTYDGNPHTATAASITGVNGETGATVGSVDVSGTTHTNAGNYSSDSWSFTGTANYNNIAATTITDTINKADATVVVTPYSVTYDGQPHTATVASITGVNGESGATVGTVDVSGTTHTNAGGYAGDPWSFTGTANYNNSNGTVDDNIDKANASFTVTPYNVTYDGLSHSASVSTINGVNGETGAAVGTVDVSGTTHTSAGGYPGDPWSFTGAANYNNSNGTVDDNIDKANATVVVTPYNVTYDGQPHSATYTITGVNGETGATVGSVDVSNTTHTVAGTYSSDSWSFTGTANYNDIAATTISDTINKADATVVVTPYNVTYDTNAHTATYSVTGVGTDTAAAGSSISVSATTHTAAGTYNGDAWSFTGGNNYNDQNGTVDDYIGKANANCSSITGYSVTYDTVSHTATGTCQGVGADGTLTGLNLSGTTHTLAGNYPTDPWTFTDVSGNYNNTSGTAADSISKRNTLTTVSSSLNPSTFGQSVSFAATVVGTGAGAGNPSGGSVQFKIDGGPFGAPVAVVAGSASSGSSTTLSAGSHTVEAIFTSSDTNFNGSSDFLDGAQTVNNRNTLTTVSSSQNSSIYGASVSFTATIVGTGAGAGNPTGGSVQFKVDNANFGAPVALIAGSATSGSTTTLSVGNHIVEAVFTTSDANFNNSSDLLDGGQMVSAWTITGFYQPVDMPIPAMVINTIKGGSTVPLKFNIYAGTPGPLTERKSITDVMFGSVQVAEYNCATISGYESPADVTNTGATSLRYDTSQFIQNWQTPKPPNKCYQVRMTAIDGSHIDAFFKTK